MSKYQPYPEYKVTGKAWLPAIPKDWKALSLKFILENRVKDGPHETPEFLSEGVPFLSVDGIQGSKLVFCGCRYISREDHERYAIKCLPKFGDVLLGKAASVGKVAFVDTKQEFNVWSPLAVLAPKSPDLGRFIFYSMQSTYLQAQCEVNSNASTQKNLSMGDIDNLYFGAPPNQEAAKITSFLDQETTRIDTLIKKKARFIELLKEKRQAMISHAVTKGLDPGVEIKDSGIEWLGSVPKHWRVMPIKRLTSIRRGASPRPIDDQKYFDENGDYAWVRIADVSASSGTLKKTKQTLSKLGSSLSVKMEPGDLFLSIAGTVGKPCITNLKCCIHDGFVYFPNLRVSPMFLFRIFETGNCYFGLGKMNTQLNLNTETVGGISIALPPEKEIHEILSYIDQEKNRINILIKKSEKSIKLLKEHRAALISAAVTGKIDVRNYAKKTNNKEVA